VLARLCLLADLVYPSRLRNAFPNALERIVCRVRVVVEGALPQWDRRFN
jgi:hypothetical protein